MEMHHTAQRVCSGRSVAPYQKKTALKKYMADRGDRRVTKAVLGVDQRGVRPRESDEKTTGH